MQPLLVEHGVGGVWLGLVTGAPPSRMFIRNADAVSMIRLTILRWPSSARKHRYLGRCGFSALPAALDFLDMMQQVRKAIYELLSMNWEVVETDKNGPKLSPWTKCNVVGCFLGTHSMLSFWQTSTTRLSSLWCRETSGWPVVNEDGTRPAAPVFLREL